MTGSVCRSAASSLSAPVSNGSGLSTYFFLHAYSVLSALFRVSAVLFYALFFAENLIRNEFLQKEAHQAAPSLSLFLCGPSHIIHDNLRCATLLKSPPCGCFSLRLFASCFTPSPSLHMAPKLRLRLAPSVSSPAPRNSFTQTDYYRATREEYYSPLPRVESPISPTSPYGPGYHPHYSTKRLVRLHPTRHP
ncbi:hypothetical protein C8F04DRAFT_706652 [Mycena alexandri]|uniref:Uncharacterized protein n=1 Tax=Mycena alexandri TaxID=1745969 RepID=A0AAD6SRP8_9AGAR|nr:hypothetical protein C8F04DRAFT_706652 [Mycena alexandri]